ncbi:hypothetical protein CYMTET_23489, partial [Cymbomonas tetramitiformis]
MNFDGKIFSSTICGWMMEATLMNASNVGRSRLQHEDNSRVQTHSAPRRAADAVGISQHQREQGFNTLLSGANEDRVKDQRRRENLGRAGSGRRRNWQLDGEVYIKTAEGGRVYVGGEGPDVPSEGVNVCASELGVSEPVSGDSRLANAVMDQSLDYADLDELGCTDEELGCDRLMSAETPGDSGFHHDLDNLNTLGISGAETVAAQLAAYNEAAQHESEDDLEYTYEEEQFEEYGEEDEELDMRASQAMETRDSRASAAQGGGEMALSKHDLDVLRDSMRELKIASPSKPSGVAREDDADSVDSVESVEDGTDSPELSRAPSRECKEFNSDAMHSSRPSSRAGGASGLRASGGMSSRGAAPRAVRPLSAQRKAPTPAQAMPAVPVAELQSVLQAVARENSLATTSKRVVGAQEDLEVPKTSRGSRMPAVVGMPLDQQFTAEEGSALHDAMASATVRQHVASIEQRRSKVGQAALGRQPAGSTEEVSEEDEILGLLSGRLQELDKQKQKYLLRVIDKLERAQEAGLNVSHMFASLDIPGLGADEGSPGAGGSDWSLQTASPAKQSPAPAAESSEAAAPAKEPSGAVVYTLRLLSSWGGLRSVGLTEVDFYDRHNKRILLAPGSVTLRGGAPEGQASAAIVRRLVDLKAQTTNDRNMWVGQLPQQPAGSPLELRFCMPAGVGTVSTLQIWNYNKSINESAKGVREMQVYLDSELVWQGIVARGTGNTTADFSTSVRLSDDAPVSSHPSSISPSRTGSTVNSGDGDARASIDSVAESTADSEVDKAGPRDSLQLARRRTLGTPGAAPGPGSSRRSTDGGRGVPGRRVQTPFAPAGFDEGLQDSMADSPIWLQGKGAGNAAHIPARDLPGVDIPLSSRTRTSRVKFVEGPAAAKMAEQEEGVEPGRGSPTRAPRKGRRASGYDPEDSLTSRGSKEEPLRAPTRDWDAAAPMRSKEVREENRPPTRDRDAAAALRNQLQQQQSAPPKRRSTRRRLMGGGMDAVDEASTRVSRAESRAESEVPGEPALAEDSSERRRRRNTLQESFDSLAHFQLTNLGRIQSNSLAESAGSTSAPPAAPEKVPLYPPPANLVVLPGFALPPTQRSSMTGCPRLGFHPSDHERVSTP